MLRHDGNNQLKPDKNNLQNMGKTNGALLKLRSLIRGKHIFNLSSEVSGNGAEEAGGME